MLEGNIDRARVQREVRLVTATNGRNTLPDCIMAASQNGLGALDPLSGFWKTDIEVPTVCRAGVRSNRAWTRGDNTEVAMVTKMEGLLSPSNFQTFGPKSDLISQRLGVEVRDECYNG